MSSTTVAECNAFPIVRVALRIHALYDLPPELSRLDGKNEQLEVVVRPVVKYTHLERRITHLQLGERVFPFAVPAICFKGGRFVLDFDNVQAERGKSPDGSGGKTTHHRDVQRTVPELKDEGRNGILSETVSENSTLLEFPCPKGVKALICVMIGVRQRCAGISVVRWITGDLSTRTVAEGAGFFSVAAEEVYRKKTVPRIVGLSVGGVLCSVTVNPTDDREEVRERLESDRRRLFTAHNCEQLREVDIDSLLLSGFSEQDVYRRMLLLVDPEHYVRRLDELIELYSSNGASDLNRSAFLQGDPAAQEVELMRRAHIEVGPECCTVSARYRLLAFRKKYSLTDQNIIACLQPVVGDNINELLDVDPEVIFDALTKVFGREPRPTSYLFPARTYSPDRRTFLFDALRQSSSHHADKDAEPLLSASGKRAPLTVSPCERPLCWGSLTTSHGHPPGEVEILRAKYAPEFGLIVPVIAAALQLAVDRNGQLATAGTPHACSTVVVPANQQGLLRQISLQDFVRRTAEHTFISPSSLLGSIILLDRLCLQHPDVVITESNVMHLFLASARVASKVIELRSINNRHFANAFGVDTKSMNLLEERFIKLLNFDLLVSPEVFGEYAALMRLPVAPTPWHPSKHRLSKDATPAPTLPLSPKQRGGPSHHPQKCGERASLTAAYRGTSAVYTNIYGNREKGPRCVLTFHGSASDVSERRSSNESRTSTNPPAQSKINSNCRPSVIRCVNGGGRGDGSSVTGNNSGSVVIPSASGSTEQGSADATRSGRNLKLVM